MIKESEIVTKRFLAKELAMFGDKLRAEMKEQKFDILHEVRIMIHETMAGSMENMKTYYESESKKYMAALLLGFRDEMLVYKDQMKAYWDRLDNHETRITKLEGPAL